MIDVISYASGMGANNPGCQDGPLALKNALSKTAAVLNWLPAAHAEQKLHGLAALDEIANLSKQTAQLTYAATQAKRPFISLGGDHSSAIGTWSGAAAALQDQGELGLIWFDAHMDSHTLETTPSSNIHGMPLAALLGYGAIELTNLFDYQPKIKPQNTVLIGVRSFERGEAILLNKLHVKIFYMNEVKQRGMQAIIAEAIEIVSHHTINFGISIDLDGIDPQDAPGVGTPAPDGVNAEDFIQSLNLIRQHPKWLAAEITEFNPHLDQDNKTTHIAMKIMQTLYL